MKAPMPSRSPWDTVPLPSDSWTRRDTVLAILSAATAIVAVAYAAGWVALALLPWLALCAYEVLRAWAKADTAALKLTNQRDQATRIAQKTWPEFRAGTPRPRRIK